MIVQTNAKESREEMQADTYVLSRGHRRSDIPSLVVSPEAAGTQFPPARRYQIPLQVCQGCHASRHILNPAMKPAPAHGVSPVLNKAHHQILICAMRRARGDTRMVDYCESQSDARPGAPKTSFALIRQSQECVCSISRNIPKEKAVRSCGQGLDSSELVSRALTPLPSEQKEQVQTLWVQRLQWPRKYARCPVTAGCRRRRGQAETIDGFAYRSVALAAILLCHLGS